MKLRTQRELEIAAIYAKRLCPRELEIAATIAKGHNIKETATLLGMTENSVKTRCCLIYEKLDLQSWGDPRSRLVLWYISSYRPSDFPGFQVGALPAK